MNPTLWEINNYVAGAIENIEYAIKLLTRIVSDGRGPDDGWPAAGEYLDNLEATLKALKAAEPADFKQARDEEAAYIDEMSDRADAASY